MVRLSELRPEVRARVKLQLAATRARRGPVVRGTGGGDSVVSARVKRGIKKSEWLAAEFIERCRRRGIAEPVAEFKFLEDRKFRFDLAWVDQKLALEIDGGVFMKGGGGHNRGAAVRRDHEKGNLAAACGWRVLRVFPEVVLGPGTFELVGRALGL